MVLAISLIKSVLGQEKAAYHALKEVPGIKNLYHTFGEHDFFLILEAENTNGLTEILNHIAEISSVGEVKRILVGPTGRDSWHCCETKYALCAA
jgi:hypothetical protein